MKIGVITLPLNTNYGGILQAYAMQKVLTDMGHTPVTIDCNREVRLPLKTRYLVYAKNAFKHYLLGEDNIVFPDIEFNKEWNYKTQYTRVFIEKYIRRKIVKNINDVDSKGFDAYIVGSDQIWRPKYNHRFPGVENSFLRFTKDWNVKRIAYATSFGCDEWEYSEEETNSCKELAKKFDAISVREESAVKICKERLNTEAIHLLDPTMLLTTKDYIKLFETAQTTQSPGDLMCYILDRNNDTQQIIKSIATNKELTPFETNSRVEEADAQLKEKIQPPVECWLRGFYDAEYIVTDSFHACVFSILFKKPFIVYGNKDRGLARFNSLLKTFGLQERLIGTPEEAEQIINKPIDWDNVEKRLKEMREKSLKFLLSSLA